MHFNNKQHLELIYVQNENFHWLNLELWVHILTPTAIFHAVFENCLMMYTSGLEIASIGKKKSERIQFYAYLFHDS